MISATIQISLNLNYLGVGVFKHFKKYVCFLKNRLIISGAICHFLILPVYFFKQCMALRHMQLKCFFLRSNEVSAVPCVLSVHHKKF